MKKLKTLALAATVLASSAAFADGIYLDANADGTFINLSELNITANPNVYDVTQYLGTDGILNDNDRFSESVTFDILSYVLPNSSVSSLFDADIAALVPGSEVAMQLVVDVQGFVSNVSTNYSLMDSTWFVNGTDPSGGLTAAGVAALNADSDGDGASDFAEASFNATTQNINFDGGTMGLFADVANSNLSVLDFSSKIGEWDVVGGLGDSVFPGTAATDFAFQTEFNTAFYNANSTFLDSIWQNVLGDSLFTMVNNSLEVAFKAVVRDLSAPQQIVGVGSDQSGAFVKVSVNDEGGTIRFNVPEPTSIAILGLGLLGFAGARRRKS